MSAGVVASLASESVEAPRFIDTHWEEQLDVARQLAALLVGKKVKDVQAECPGRAITCQKLWSICRSLLLDDPQRALDCGVHQLWQSGLVCGIDQAAPGSSEPLKRSRGRVRRAVAERRSQLLHLRQAAEGCSSLLSALGYGEVLACDSGDARCRQGGTTAPRPAQGTEARGDSGEVAKRLVAHHALCMLGDARRLAVEWLPRPDLEPARRAYACAGRLLPALGLPFNSLGKMFLLEGRPLAALYCYVRAVAASVPSRAALHNTALLRNWAVGQKAATRTGPQTCAAPSREMADLELRAIQAFANISLLPWCSGRTVRHQRWKVLRRASRDWLHSLEAAVARNVVGMTHGPFTVHLAAVCLFVLSRSDAKAGLTTGETTLRMTAVKTVSQLAKIASSCHALGPLEALYALTAWLAAPSAEGLRHELWPLLQPALSCIVRHNACNAAVIAAGGEGSTGLCLAGDEPRRVLLIERELCGFVGLFPSVTGEQIEDQEDQASRPALLSHLVSAAEQVAAMAGETLGCPGSIGASRGSSTPEDAATTEADTVSATASDSDSAPSTASDELSSESCALPATGAEQVMSNPLLTAKRARLAELDCFQQADQAIAEPDRPLSDGPSTENRSDGFSSNCNSWPAPADSAWRSCAYPRC